MYKSARLLHLVDPVPPLHLFIASEQSSINPLSSSRVKVCQFFVHIQDFPSQNRIFESYVTMIATDIVPMAYPTALLGFFMFILASWLLTLIGYGNLNVTNSLHFVPRSVDYYEEERNIFSFIENSYVWPEFCLVNISQFIASRGSTSSKVSEIVLPVIGLSGALGSVIWYTIQKGSLWQFGWAFSGFLSMLIVPLFEIFQAPAFFVSYKVLITKRFIWTLFPFNKRKFIKEEHVIQLINKSEKLKGFFNINTSTYEISNPDYDDVSSTYLV